MLVSGMDEWYENVNETELMKIGDTLVDKVSDT